MNSINCFLLGPFLFLSSVSFFNNCFFSFSELNVTIIPDYISAPGENPEELGPNEFTAGGVLSLTCMAQGASGGLTYSWSVAGNPVSPPDCTCNIDTTPTIPMTLEVGSVLQSFRAGTYTCTVSETGRTSSESSEDFSVVLVGEYCISVYMISRGEPWPVVV